ncbi:MAG: ATP phosphoribosyltransferase regulatory subunit [Jaaginema sp. PMC 1079.18]|nr:ATP phosphoribosyltransferase regulatory subunit [Jaaginema sp. PMC 1080.18]MEC4850348.1 ATP phosphoribosyltransferase regulatory subunit [Jaaginema sp. PMC 1079.18]MEC4867146.1 ATP phosphoribosyltransferase regulatory subunit [Jaaginema sp. PMC 1078.18]
MSTIHQPPAGARDLLPLEVAQKRWISDRLQEVFQRWGYQRIITSTLEWLDTLTAGGAIERSTVIQLANDAQGTLGLRPELTASIARAAVTRMAGQTQPQRLYYSANVFRRPKSRDRGQQLEFYQAGVELLRFGGILADAEMILLLSESLQALEVKPWNLIIGEAGLTRSLLNGFPEAVRESVRYCLSNLDWVGLNQLPLAEGDRQLATQVFDLRGNPQVVLEKVSKLHLDADAQQKVNDLKALIDLIEQSSPSPLPLVLDLSLIETINYYTGVVFEVVSHTRVLGKGGRYDTLLELYDHSGQSTPGIGFALNIDSLHACLLNTPIIPQATPANDWLVIPKTPDARAAALIYAHKLRTSEYLVRVEVDLGGKDPETIRQYARLNRIERLVWMSADGTPQIETL